MKYLLKTKASNNPDAQISVSFVEDSNGNITDEICFSFIGLLNDFSYSEESIAIMTEKDLHNLIGMLLQVQQKLRNERR